MADTRAMRRKIAYLFTGAGMLAVCSVVAKLLGAMYRIPLTNVLGGEGMGLYQLVFPLYTLLLTVSSGGLPVAISRLVAVKLVGGDEAGAAKIVRVAVVALGLVGLACSLVLALFARQIATVQGNASAAPAYLGIAPAVTLVAVLSCFRGYFQGRENMLPTAVSQLIEQAVKLVAGLIFSRVLVKRSVSMGVLGALLGVSLSELVALAGLALTYFFTRRRVKRSEVYARRRRLSHSLRSESGFGKVSGARTLVAASEVAEDFAGDVTMEMGLAAAAAGLKSSCKKEKTRNVHSVRAILKGIAAVALPVTFGSLVLPVTQVVDSVLIINILSRIGYTREQSTMAYGLMGGTVMTLINMPVVVIFAFSAALLPKIAKCCADRETVSREAGFALKLCAAMGLVVALAFIVYAREIVTLLYSRGLSKRQIVLASRLLSVSGITVFFVSVVQVCTAVLQGLNLPKVPAVNLAVGALVKLAATTALLYFVGIYGAAIGSIACYAVTTVLDMLSVKRRVKMFRRPIKAYPLLVAAAAFTATALTLNRLLTGGLLRLTVALPVSAAAFVIAVFACKWFDKGEIERVLPFLRK